MKVLSGLLPGARELPTEVKTISGEDRLAGLTWASCTAAKCGPECNLH